tara:strand:+ start:2359 stop:2745 length:387 start_codon:yes stop_codon:yes gene_type:complete
MALSNLNKDNIERLFQMINLNDTDRTDYNNLLNIRSNYATYSKLELIARQIEFLKTEALNIVKIHDLNNDLNNIKCSFRKVPGNYYYVYKNDNEKYLSLISPDEWNKKEDFLAKVYYDYDYQFYNVDM